MYIYAKNGTGQITLKKKEDFSYKPKHEEPLTQEETKVENPEKDIEMDEMKYSLEEISEEERLFD